MMRTTMAPERIEAEIAESFDILVKLLKHHLRDKSFDPQILIDEFKKIIPRLFYDRLMHQMFVRARNTTDEEAIPDETLLGILIVMIQNIKTYFKNHPEKCDATVIKTLFEVNFVLGFKIVSDHPFDLSQWAECFNREATWLVSIKDGDHLEYYFTMLERQFLRDIDFNIYQGLPHEPILQSTHKKSQALEVKTMAVAKEEKRLSRSNLIIPKACDIRALLSAALDHQNTPIAIKKGALAITAKYHRTPSYIELIAYIHSQEHTNLGCLLTPEEANQIIASKDVIAFLRDFRTRNDEPTFSLAKEWLLATIKSELASTPALPIKTVSNFAELFSTNESKQIHALPLHRLTLHTRRQNGYTLLEFLNVNKQPAPHIRLLDENDTRNFAECENTQQLVDRLLKDGTSWDNSKREPVANAIKQDLAFAQTQAHAEKLLSEANLKRAAQEQKALENRHNRFYQFFSLKKKPADEALMELIGDIQILLKSPRDLAYLDETTQNALIVMLAAITPNTTPAKKGWFSKRK